MDANDKKSLWILAFLLVLLVGFLVMTRGCDKKEFTDDEMQDIVEPTPTPTPIEEKDSTENTENETELSIRNIVVSGFEQEKVLEETKEETVDLSKYFSFIASDYQVEVGDDLFILPEIETVEGIFLKVEYFFQDMYGSDYFKTSEFDINRVGTYKIVYTLSYRKQSLAKEFFVNISDTELPVIEGIVEKYDMATGITSYEPVKSGSKINQDVEISFRDNYELSYAEYYKAKYETIEGLDTIEQEGMQEIIEIDLGQGLLLSEEGEYHIRAYDTSMNVSEYIVTIDKTSPNLQVSCSRIDNDHTLVMIDSDEEIESLDGWIISDDHQRIQRVYENSQLEEVIVLEVTVLDIAGNSSTVTVEKADMEVSIQGMQNNQDTMSQNLNTYENSQMEEVTVLDIAENSSTNTVEITDMKVSIQVKQNNQDTMSKNLNTNDGDVTVSFDSNRVMELIYSVDGSDFTVYQGENLDIEGYYTFQAIFEGQIMNSLEFNISSMTPGN